jgi:hypothetical protein
MHPGIEMYVCTMFDVLQVHITCISSFLYDVEGSVSQTSNLVQVHPRYLKLPKAPSRGVWCAAVLIADIFYMILALATCTRM